MADRGSRCRVDHLVIDRGYINSPLVDDVLRRRGKIVCKPWQAHNGQLFPKSAFTLNRPDRTLECPNGQVQRVTFGTTVEFDPDICGHCGLRPQCTTAELGTGRSVAIAENEPLQHRLRKQVQTSAGRAALRERTMVEHKLVHISQRQGNYARYVGIRKNVFRPPPRRIHPKPGDDPPHGDRRAKGCVMTSLSNGGGSRAGS